MTIRLESGAAERIAGRHDAAGESIESAASTAPPAPDAGAGAEHISAIVTTVLEAAGYLVGINHACAAAVRAAGANVEKTDAEIAALFAALTETPG